MHTLQRFAWVFAVLGLVVGVASASYYYLFTEFDRTWTILTIACGALFSAYLYLDRESVADAAQSRQFRYGSGAFALVIIAGCLAIGLNMLASKRDHRFDLTQDKRFTLSEKTISVVSGLTEDVTILAFFVRGDPRETELRNLTDGMKPYSSHLRVEFVNPLRDPDRAQENDVDPDRGGVILKKGEKKQRLDQKIDQEALTTALIRLTSDSDHKVCWVMGHGEADPDDDRSRDGLGSAVLSLEDGNYTVAKRQILIDGFASCAAAVVARPLVDYTAAEREAIAAYVASGGRLLALLEPELAPELSKDLARYGVAVGNDFVLEDNPLARLNDMPPTFIILAEPQGSYAMHPITEKLHGMIVLGLARSVGAIPGEGRQTTEILQTTEAGWGETDFTTETPERGADPGERQGRVPVAVAVEIQDPATIAVRTKPLAAVDTPAPEPVPDAPATDTDAVDGPDVPNGVVVADPRADVTLGDADPSKGVPADFAPKAGGRVVVIGDSDFLGNQLVGLPGNNRDLFLNAIAWLVEEEAQLGEQEDDSGKQRLTMSLLGAGLLFLTTMIFVPGASALAGAAMLVRRRWL